MPISGGVQSATSAHGLPRPVLAVRNSMEQARFAHLCTVMSRMHHRREGYPFGSLVDFAPDSMGHTWMERLIKRKSYHFRRCLPTFRRTTVIIYFVGGFGTVAWVDVNEYEELKPDKIAFEGGELYLKEPNAMFSKPMKELLSSETEVDDVALISIDSRGCDVRVRQGAQVLDLSVIYKSTYVSYIKT